MAASTVKAVDNSTQNVDKKDDQKQSLSTNIDPDILKQAQEYISWEPHKLFRDQVSNALSTSNASLLNEMFSKRIAFGTAGLRSKMYGGYKYMNDLIIIQTCQGLIRYIELKQNKAECYNNGVIIGYDARYNSSRFAKIALSLFLLNGFRIYYFNKYAATPFIPYGILKLKCSIGLVITASHNPKDDNGFKVYWNNGSQIIPPHDSGISNQINNNLQPWYDNNILTNFDPYNNTDDKYKNKSMDITDLVTNSYFNDCASNYSFLSSDDKKDADKIVKVTYTPMHGIGGYWMIKNYEAFKLPLFVKVAQQFEPDPEFSTVKFPNPEEGAGALKLSMETADKCQSTLILANDPDADRLAIAEKINNKWYIYNGNEIAILLSWWYYTNYISLHPNVDKSKLCMIASTVSSKYLESMANKEGFVFVDTLTGFKWMGNEAISMISRGYTFLFAYEVEIGFLIGDISFDKDGIRSGAVFNELAIFLKKYENKTCFDKLNELRAKYGYYEMHTSYRRMDNILLMKIMNKLRNWDDNNTNKSYPPSMGIYKINRIRDVTTGYDTGEINKISKLPKQPNQQMITFWFENGSTATIRASGTEPKLKFYVETKDDNDPQIAKALLTDMTKALLKEFMQMD